MTNREGLPTVSYCLKPSTRAYVTDSRGGVDVSTERKKQATPFHDYIKDVIVIYSNDCG